MPTPLDRFESSEGALCERLVAVLLKDGLSVEIRATGSSMSPFIRPGDVVVLDPLGRLAPRTGEVVGFLRGPSRLAIHRVVAKQAGVLVMRGDGASVDDGPVLPGDIVGRVRSVHRHGDAVRSGLGPEGRLIALLSRTNLLSPLVHAARTFLRITRGDRGR